MENPTINSTELFGNKANLRCAKKKGVPGEMNVAYPLAYLLNHPRQQLWMGAHNSTYRGYNKTPPI